MRVAKHWRNRKLRYRLIRNSDQYRREGSHFEQKRLGGRARDSQTNVMPVKVLS